MISSSDYMEQRSVPIRSLPTEPSSQTLLVKTTTKKKLKELVEQPFIGGKGTDLSEHRIQKLNNTFHWEVARINALLNTILVNNAVTPNDTNQLRGFNDQLIKLSNKIELLQKEHHITSKQGQHASTLIGEAQDAIEDIYLFVGKLKEYNREGENLDACCDALIDLSYDPKSGDPLDTMNAMKDAAVSLAKMGRIVEPLLDDKEGTATAKLVNLFGNDLRHFSWIVEDWSESVERASKTLLKDLSKFDNSEEKLQQYEALNRHLQQMQKEIKEVKKELRKLEHLEPLPKSINSDYNSIFSSLKNTKNNLAASQEKIEGILEKNKTEFPRINYGDSTWNKLALKHISRQPPSWMMKKIQDVTNVQEWSDSTKDMVYRLFTLMQLDPLSKLAGAYDLLSGNQGANLKKMANVLQEKAFREIPPETIKDIEYETATFGTLLMFNYKGLHHPKTREQLTHKCPAIRQALQSALAQFGSTPPNQKQVRELVDSYRLERLLKENSLSKSYMSQTFSASRIKDKQELPKEKTELALVQETGIEEITSDASNQQGLVPSIIKSLGSLSTIIGWSGYTQEAAIPQQHFVKNVQQETYDKLTQALDKVQKIEKQLQELHEPDLNPLKEETALVHRELLKEIANIPSLTCSLLNLANWTQNADDKCFMVDSLNEQIKTFEQQISVTKETLSSAVINPSQEERFHGKELNQINILSHVWELSGIAKLKKKPGSTPEDLEYFDEKTIPSDEFSLEGSLPSITIKYMRYTLQGFTSAYPDILSKSERSSLLNALAIRPFLQADLMVNQLIDDPAQGLYKAITMKPFLPNSETMGLVMSRIKRHQPVLISTGWTNHSIAIVIFGNYLLYCNRGQGSALPIEAYKINPKKLTREMVENEFYWDNYNEFKEKMPKILLRLDYEVDSICKSMMKLNPLKPFQLVGNCAWESAETANFGMVALQRLVAQDANKLDIFERHEIIEKTYQDFQAWLQFTKISILEDYVKSDDENTKYFKNTELLRAIFRTDLEEKKIEPKGKKCKVLLDNLSKQLIPQAYDDFLIKREKIFEQYVWKQDVEKKFESIKEHSYKLFPSLLYKIPELDQFPKWKEKAQYLGRAIILVTLLAAIFKFSFKKIDRLAGQYKIF